MKQRDGYVSLKLSLAALAVAVLALWMGLHFRLLFSSQNGSIRCVLTLLFSVLIAIRPKTKSEPLAPAPLWLLTTAAILGVACLLAGLIIPIRQLEWIGLLLLIFACLSRALPATYSNDIPLALLVLYLINPLPTPWFGHLQAAMQVASVHGSEWLLHIFNGRAWADGLVLRTGLHIFEVPAWCSGMRTATTVAILSLALGILRRLRWHETLFLIAWSLFHALILNILRISAMVAFAHRMPDRSGMVFLHDTAGIIVIAGVVIVYFEMLYLNHRKQRRLERDAELNAEQMDALSEFPPFWHSLNSHKGKITFTALMLGVALAAGYRSRPYHRAMMLKDVAIALRDNGDLAAAQKLSDIVSEMIPNDLEWKFATIRLHLIRGEHDQVLSKLDTLEGLEANHLSQKRILKAYALMSLGRIDDAAEIVNQLPEQIRDKDPRVAMILAEMALRGGDSDAVAMHVTSASSWAPNVGRIRNLYPYLRVHRQWNAMTASDIKIPYADPVQALSILEAYMNLNLVPKVSDITLQATARWPHDMRVLEPLFFMALKRGDSEWLDRFSEHLLRSIAHCNNPDPLYETLYKCFALHRPDLSWAIYHRIAEIDANHPTLPMSIAKYGHKWFAFNKRRLGMPTARATETLNLKPYFLLGKMLPTWEKIIQNIPEGDALATEETTPIRKQFLALAIQRFKAREQADTLSLDMQHLYAHALEMSGRIDLAEPQLKRIVAKHPEEAAPARALLSEFYERKGDWINVYETLRTYLYPTLSQTDTGNMDALPWPPTPIQKTDTERIHLNPLLRLVKSQLELQLNLSALYTAKKTLQLYPYSPRAIEYLAAAHIQLGDSEAALQLLSKPRIRNQRSLDILEAKALLETRRYTELNNFCRGALLPNPHIPQGSLQQATLPPAELSLLWHRMAIPSEAKFAENAKQVEHNISSAGMGLQNILTLWLSAYQQHCAGDLSDPGRWLACGRDPVEQAMTLNQLTLLLCREGRFSEAKSAARQAVSALPDMPVLWEILISLSGGDPEIIALSRKFCPDAPELWLAELVTHTHPFRTADEEEQARIRQWVNSTIDDALESNMPPATLTRAGEFLWRNALRPEATRLARATTENARGLLPCYVLAIRCALDAGDQAWALTATEKAIASSLQPLPELYQNLVSLKIADGEINTDPDMVNALRQLRKSDPDNPLWPQMLGYIRFQRGGWEIVDAMFEMNVAIAGGATNQMPYVISAEASRLLRDYDRAADILKQGLKYNPDHPILLNNLAYTLSHETNRISEATALIPTLQHLAENNPQIQDTLAVVFIKSGQLEKAHEIVTTILQKAEPGSTLWFRGNMHLAEMAWGEGRGKEARTKLENLLKSSQHIPDEDLLAANALLTEIVGADAEYINPMRAFIKEDLDKEAP